MKDRRTVNIINYKPFSNTVSTFCQNLDRALISISYYMGDVLYFKAGQCKKCGTSQKVFSLDHYIVLIRYFEG